MKLLTMPLGPFIAFLGFLFEYDDLGSLHIFHNMGTDHAVFHIGMSKVKVVILNQQNTFENDLLLLVDHGRVNALHFQDFAYSHFILLSTGF